MLRPIAACIFAGFAATAHAQFIDDVELRQEGANAVLQVRFVTPVLYSKSISARASDLVQAFYTVLPTRDQISDVISERRLAAAGDIPSISVTDESDNSTAQANSSRKLVIRFAAPVRFRVRAGRDNRSIEVVFEGLGSSVRMAAAAPLAPLTLATVLGGATTPSPASAEIEASSTALLTTAQSAFDAGQYPAATESLNKLLDLPPNSSSRRAQELVGLARLKAGDPTRAAKEFELFLKLYPQGADSDRVRQMMPSLPSVQATTAGPKTVVEATSSTNGSVSMFYYGGKSNVRSQEFQDSVLGGLPVLQSDTTLSATDQRQLQTNVDLNWRYRDAEKDMRFVFRDNYSLDQIKDVGKQRLSALYFDYRSMLNGTSMRLGRQSPNGGGVLYRFDGIQAGYTFQPKWKVNAVFGQPSDTLLDTSRKFYGMSVDAEALTKELSGSAFVIEQVIDGETDRRGVGADLRYFSGGVSASAQLDYDLIIKGFNVAALQATWQLSESTVVNAMFDRRTTPILSLGNYLFFQDPALLAPARRIQDLLGVKPIETLRDSVKGLTPYQTQAHIGGTTYIAKDWQLGADLSVTNVDAIPKVVDLLPDGQASTGNLWSAGVQLIGTNLYSARDTHVFNLTFMGGPIYHGTLLSYNNLSGLSEKWQMEPSLKFYTQSSSDGASNDIWTAGLRAVYHVRQQVALETELTYEHSNQQGASKLTGPGSVTSSNRMNYYLGVRYEF
ncbi:MAG: outer membrane protein assembly factor BamD [Rhodoferax sp.]|nr:outer membrane protein assembly factor BamD [Rhodoferax sp.]